MEDSEGLAAIDAGALSSISSAPLLLHHLFKFKKISKLQLLFHCDKISNFQLTYLQWETHDILITPISFCHQY